MKFLYLAAPKKWNIYKLWYITIMFNRIIKKLKANFFLDKDQPLEDKYITPIEIYADSSRFYEKDDLVFFKNLNAYGAFKYDIVRDLFNSNNDSIGASLIALELNNRYFSKNEGIHKHNKKSAINHLTFLSSKLQYSENQYTELLFNIFSSNFPKGEKFNLADYLVNPLIFIDILKEYDLLEEIFVDLNPDSKTFSVDGAIQLVRDFIEDGDKLENVIIEHIFKGGRIPQKMQLFLDDLISEGEDELVPVSKFLRSIIFVGVETTASFVCTFIYNLFTKYKEILEKNDYQSEVYEIANELLRIYPPVPFIFRTIWNDTNYLGVDLKKGTNLILFLGAANMDPNVFDNPNEIRGDRSEKHLSFGGGSYTCIGRFASYRMALNILSYLMPFKQRITFVDENAKHFFHNSIQKLPVNVIYND